MRSKTVGRHKNKEYTRTQTDSDFSWDYATYKEGFSEIH